MRVVIAGGHGQIALLLGKLLAERGDEVVGIIRNPAHIEDVQLAGMTPVVLDLEAVAARELEEVLVGADALVFAAGAGPGSGVARKLTVDHEAADKCTSAAIAAGVNRVIQISAMGTDEPPQDDHVFSHYLRAKAAAEQTLAATDLKYVILRPGGLIDDPPTDSIQLGRHVPRGRVARADVAAVVVALLDRPQIARATLELIGGEVPIAVALDRLGG